MNSITIVGYGSFGRFLTSLVPRHIRITVYDPASPDIPSAQRIKSLVTAAAADIIVLAIPLASLAVVVRELAPHLRPSTLLVDVCSVKTRAEKIYQDCVPKHSEVLLTHPLFGPESAAKITRGHTLIVTSQPTPRALPLLKFCTEHLGLTLYHTSAEKHDEIMADIHALTFFIARGLSCMNLHDLPFATPSFRMLKELVEYDQHHSEALFVTMENGNPFAKTARTRFMTALQTIDKELEQSCRTFS